jgi:DNA topoisomerase IA
MNYNYETYFKMIENRKYYFVKKYLQFKEYGDSLCDVLEGYGMHTDFSKACIIAGIKDNSLQQKLFAQMEAQLSEIKVIEMNQPVSVIKKISG